MDARKMAGKIIDSFGFFLMAAFALLGGASAVIGIYNGIERTTNTLDVATRFFFGLAVFMGCGTYVHSRFKRWRRAKRILRIQDIKS